MKRAMIQVYVHNSVQAVELYKRAFDAAVKCEYKNEDGEYVHAELDIFGNTISVSESGKKKVTGTTMQICFQYKEDEIECLEKAYNILKVDGEIIHPLGECFYSNKMADFIDKFGVRWCLFS